MPTMIAVITQEEIEIPTMALPLLETFLAPQIPERKMTQQTLVFDQKSAPTHVVTTVKGHFRDSGFVTTHMRKVKNKKQSNKKASKTINSKKKTGTAKLGAFAKLDDNCEHKENAQYAQSVHLDQLFNLVRGVKK
jgi:ethanolamine utilization protein EutQ (cupin superfamily)